MSKIEWHTEKRRVKDLICVLPNPRQISKEQFSQLKKSIEKFGYAEIIAINRDGVVIAGHMRVRALLDMQWAYTEIDVRVPNRQLSFDEAREYLIRSNKNTGDWDWDLLSQDFEVEELKQWGFEDKDLHDGISIKNDEEKEVCLSCGQKIKKSTDKGKKTRRSA